MRNRTSPEHHGLAHGRWLPDMDLNHDKQIQSLLCYRYTIGQTRGITLECPRWESSLGTRRAQPATGKGAFQPGE